MTVAIVTVRALENTLVILKDHIERFDDQYLLMANSSKEFFVKDTETVQIGKTELHLVKPEPANATVSPL